MLICYLLHLNVCDDLLIILTALPVCDSVLLLLSSAESLMVVVLYTQASLTSARLSHRSSLINLYVTLTPRPSD